MRHLRTIITAVIGLGLLTLTACSGSADPSTPPPASPTTTVPPATASATPTTAPSATAPTPPVMPAAARAHTKAGAKAFVQYFWDVVNYAQRTGDTASITRIAVHGCHGCEAGVAAVDKVYSGGAVIHGGASSLENVRVELFIAGDEVFAEATVDVTNAPELDDYPGTAKDVRRSSTTVKDRMLLRATDTGWRTAQLEVAR